MLILTNIFRINGAGMICYDGLLKIIADMAGENHIIIPCSIHETIVMSEKTWLDEQVLQEMVYSVNREEVPADEILSDHPFLCMRLQDHVRKIRKGAVCTPFHAVSNHTKPVHFFLIPKRTV